MTGVVGRLAAAAVMLAQGVLPGAAESERRPRTSERELTVLTYNIIGIPCLDKNQMVVDIAKSVMDVKACEPNPGWFGQSIGKRYEVITRYLSNQFAAERGADIVALQEAYWSKSDVFDDSALQRLLRSKVYPHVATGAESTLGNSIASLWELADNNSLKSPPKGALSSGLVIFSRYPILASDTVSFGDLCTYDDCAANKGVLYVRLDLGGGMTADVYTTHMQAQPTPEGEALRKKQLQVFKDFIARTDSRATFRFFIGDFNFRATGGEDSFRRFRSMTETRHAGMVCLETKGCQVRPDGRKALLKAGGDVVDHQFYAAGTREISIVPTLVRIDTLETGGRRVSDHDYQLVRYRLGRSGRNDAEE